MALDTSNRCDGCGTQAYVSVLLPSGTELLFCGNHWDRNKHILDVETNVVDTSELEKMREQIKAEVRV
jgi:hypothetical protein